MHDNPIKALLVTKTVWVPGPTPADPPIKKVIQRVQPGLGNVNGFQDRSLQLRTHVIPADPRSPAQLACRAKFAAAMAEWKNMGAAERKYWIDLGNKSAISGMNAYTRYKLRA